MAATTTLLPQTERPPSAPRLSHLKKLLLLCPGIDPTITQARLESFTHLFAFRWTRGIITRVGRGPRAWAELRDCLTDKHVARHLLADRIPGREPIWVGSRSLATTRFFCIDVDPDRPTTARNVPSPAETRPSFTERCHAVELALYRLGIKSQSPRHVLIDHTPSGGRHYYVFLAGRYGRDQIVALLNTAGIQHLSGQTEIFPSETQGLRLPFGHLPDRIRDPQAWVQFIDDYDNRRIRRFDLATLHANLETFTSQRPQRPTPPARRTPPTSPTPPPRTTHTPVAVPAAILIRTAVDRLDDERYRRLLAAGIRRTADAEELLSLGIREGGTRNTVLKHLTAHLVWFQHLTAEDAAAKLISWAMHRRHVSQDIHADLHHGTRRVPDQITRMCKWYFDRKALRGAGAVENRHVRYAWAEIDAMREPLSRVPDADRPALVDFLLHFLHFARRHGKPHEETGRDAAPAINAVVRKWPGCHHLNYKERIEKAQAIGLLSLTKAHWQNPHGKGRTRTYRIHVPVVPDELARFGYQDARTFLVHERPQPTAVQPETTEAKSPETATSNTPLPDAKCAS